MDNASDESYTIKLMYASAKLPQNDSGYFKADRIHFGCDIDANGWLAYNWWIDPDTGGCNGGANYNGDVYLPVSFGSSGTVSRYITVKLTNGFIT